MFTVESALDWWRAGPKVVECSKSSRARAPAPPTSSECALSDQAETARLQFHKQMQHLLLAFALLRALPALPCAAPITAVPAAVTSMLANTVWSTPIPETYVLLRLFFYIISYFIKQN